MNKYFFIIALIIGGTANVFTQETFVFKSESKIYDVKVRVESCPTDEESKTCTAKATFYLLKKDQTAVIQSFEMPETYLSISGKPPKKGDVTELYGDRHGGVYFTDYNFDGIEDIAISNGYNLPYGGVSYDVFLYSKPKSRFIRNAELSELETDNIIVDVKKKLRIIETQTKSGCCWHETARFRFVNNRLQKFYVYTEDAQGDGKWMKLITRRLVNRKWRTATKRVLIDNYYKD